MARINIADKRKVASAAGGAGFIGSHLCSELLTAGSRVICVDSYLTGSRANLGDLLEDPLFRLSSTMFVMNSVSKSGSIVSTILPALRLPHLIRPIPFTP